VLPFLLFKDRGKAGDKWTVSASQKKCKLLQQNFPLIFVSKNFLKINSIMN
jgi:hypothetical protein